jgi:Tfp pilus assembly protein PilF
VSQAIDADPQAALPYNTMGVIYETREQFDKAVNAYQEAVRLQNNSACNRGIARTGWEIANG